MAVHSLYKHCCDALLVTPYSLLYSHQAVQLLCPLLVLIVISHSYGYNYNENKVKLFCMHCSPHVLTCMLSLCCFSLKAFEALVRETIESRCPTGANVETTEVHVQYLSITSHAHAGI